MIKKQSLLDGLSANSSQHFAKLRPLAIAAVTAAAIAGTAQAQTTTPAVKLLPGNLVVSTSFYDNNPSNVRIGEVLPPNCAATTGGCSASTGAPFNGIYPAVFNNDIYDGSFGITSIISLDQLNPFTGALVNTLEVPNSSQSSYVKGANELVTSFSSKSELALHLSTDGNYLTFMGYVAPVGAVDVSNSNTPGAVDPTNPVGESYYRAVAQVDKYGAFKFTETNAYSGNNGRSAILNNSDGYNLFYTAGNAGNGSNPQPAGVVLGAGAQLIDASITPESRQNPTTPTPVASFSVTELGDKQDKIGKDDNFRGETVFNNVLYYTKGSGSNGLNTVYFVDTTGTACPNGVGLPVPGAALPTKPLNYNPANLEADGLPSNICILAGFPTVLAKTANPAAYPFGLFFANATTLYVADEGDGYVGGTDLYTHAAAQTTAGLQKWIFNAATKQWEFAYTITAGLDLGKPYEILGYPTYVNQSTGISYKPATDGLRNITGYVTPGGIALIWAITSTVSGSGDPGADPNKLVAVADDVANTSQSFANSEQFTTLKTSANLQVLRGVSLTPGTTSLTLPTQN
jgi:hypothetical protein